MAHCKPIGPSGACYPRLHRMPSLPSMRLGPGYETNISRHTVLSMEPSHASDGGFEAVLQHCQSSFVTPHGVVLILQFMARIWQVFATKSNCDWLHRAQGTPQVALSGKAL